MHEPLAEVIAVLLDCVAQVWRMPIGQVWANGGQQNEQEFEAPPLTEEPALVSAHARSVLRKAEDRQPPIHSPVSANFPAAAAGADPAMQVAAHLASPALHLLNPDTTIVVGHLLREISAAGTPSKPISERRPATGEYLINCPRCAWSSGAIFGVISIWVIK